MHRKVLYEADDYTLLFQRGEEKGFAWFFRNLYPALSFYAFKITGDREMSEEIASGAFIKIWQRHEQFADAVSIRKYLYRIVRNDALKHLRKEKRSTANTKEVIYLFANEHEKDCFNSLVTTELIHELHQAINSLPAECKKVFQLMYIEGKTIQETAKALQLSTSTVKTQKKRGIVALRKSLHLPIIMVAVSIDLLRVFAVH